MYKLPDNWGKGSLPPKWGKENISYSPQKEKAHNQCYGDKKAVTNTSKPDTEVPINDGAFFTGNEIKERFDSVLPDVDKGVAQTTSLIADNIKSAGKKVTVSVKTANEKTKRKSVAANLNHKHSKQRGTDAEKIPKTEPQKIDKKKAPSSRKILMIIISVVVVVAAALACIFIFFVLNDKDKPEQEYSSIVNGESKVSGLESEIVPSSESEPTEESNPSSVESMTEASEPALSATYTSGKHGFTVTLPEAWQKYGRIVEYDDGVGFYHKSTYDAQNVNYSGLVFDIAREKESDYDQETTRGGRTLPLIAKGGYVYYYATPSDVTYNYRDSTTAEEYSELMDSIDILLQALAWEDIIESVPSISNEQSLTNEEAKEILSELIPMGKEMMGIGYGGALQFSMDDYVEDGYYTYYAVTDPNYQSIADIQAALKKVYTQQYIENTFRGFKRFTEQNGKLYIAPGGIGGGTTWNLDTLRILSQSADVAVIELKAESYGDIFTQTIEIRRVDGKWLLNSSVV